MRVAQERGRKLRIDPHAGRDDFAVLQFRPGLAERALLSTIRRELARLIRGLDHEKQPAVNRARMMPWRPQDLRSGLLRALRSVTVTDVMRTHHERRALRISRRDRLISLAGRDGGRKRP
jgi:hypothetical protein